MDENEKTLKAMSLIAAELNIQNYVSISISNGIKPGFKEVSETYIYNLADHFRNYFDGGAFSPGSVRGYKVKVGG